MRLLLLPLCVWMGLTVVTDQVVLDFNEGQECKQLNGFSWICKKLSECPKAIADLEDEIIADRCKPDDVKNPVVCCKTDIPVIVEKSKEGDVCRSDNGTNWTCKKEEDCPEAQKFGPSYKMGPISSDIPIPCNSVGSGTNLVCCKPRTEDEKKENDICRSDNGTNWTCKKEEDCPEAQRFGPSYRIGPKGSDMVFPCNSVGSGTNLVCCKPRTEDKKKENDICRSDNGTNWTCKKEEDCPEALIGPRNSDIHYPCKSDGSGPNLFCCKPRTEDKGKKIGDVCKEDNGAIWTCKKLTECPKALGVKGKRLMTQECNSVGTDLENTVVCCEPDAQPTESPEEVAKEGDVCKEESGVIWTCKTLSKCPKALGDMSKGLNPQQCNSVGSDLSKTLVCCEPEAKPPVIMKKSTEMCKKYSQFSKTCNTVETTTNRTTANPREFPHMALIGCGEKNSISWVCTGSLISERFVLGVEHCKCIDKTLPRWVRLGDYNISTTKDEEANSAKPVEFEIIERITHPNYKNNTFNHDIALYKLNSDVQFNEYIIPICLERERQFPRENVVASGWCVYDWNCNSCHPSIRLGMDAPFHHVPCKKCLHARLLQSRAPGAAAQYPKSPCNRLNTNACRRSKYPVPSVPSCRKFKNFSAGTRRKDTMQKANQLITESNDCNESYKTISSGKLENGIEDESMLCAQDSIKSPQSCKGDFGTPLQYRLSDPKCMYSLVGVNFFGSCRGNLPAVYYRVSNYVDWIEKIVWP